jgi:glycosyltransferase involved in cell wall biosynthesis
MARVVFYHPQQEVLGGGEKYLFTILEQVLPIADQPIEVIAPTRPDPSAWRLLAIDVDPALVHWRAATDLDRTRLSRTWELSPVATTASAGADLFIATCNHVPARSLARRSVVIIQFPCRDFRRVAGVRSRLWRANDRRRFQSYDTVICYSHFVQEHISRRLGIQDALVVAPPVDLPEQSCEALHEKRRMIIAVGRFAPWIGMNQKKQDLMIEAWRRLVPFMGERWELHLVGGAGADSESRSYLDDLKKRAEGLPVHFHVNASFPDLDRLYADSAIFWHAAGYGETDPQRFEHFGITTVEAMAHGCVPVVPALGGQLEIVDHGITGYLWSSVDDLIALTLQLIDQPSQAAAMRSACMAAAQRFSKARFAERISEHVLAPAGIR